MAQLTLINILLAVLGMVLQIMVTIQGVIKSPVNTFSLPRWIQENWFNTLIGIVCTIISLLMAEDMIKSFGMNAPDGSPFYKIHALVSGYAGRELVFRLLKLAQKPKE